jgi:dTDP-4-dehydrorhamnose 3,5-epimerase
MNFIKKPTSIPGCFELLPAAHKDKRGLFIKTFHAGDFKALGLETAFKENYFSVSRKGVIRGLHFQTPPAALAKLVFCTQGEIFDAVLDLRRNSKTCGKAFTLKLTAKKANMLYIPKGLAHGFCALSGTAAVFYSATAVYAPQCDTGVLWNSAGINWPCKKPVISARDAAFPALKDLKFRF